MNRILRLSALTPLVLASTAAAAGGPTANVTLSPAKVKAATTAHVQVTGPLPSGLPSSISVTVQKGFTSSVKAVKVLCTAAQATSEGCPAQSFVGNGQIVATATGLGQVTVPLTLALGAPSQAGDISTVYIYGKLGTFPLGVTARLFNTGNGLELLTGAFPALPIPGLTVQVDSLTLNAHAKQSVTKKVKVGKGKHKKTKKVTTVYSLLTNPSTCTGTWTGSVSVAFASGTVTLPLSTPCHK